MQINEHREVMVSETGDFLIVPTGTVSNVINREIDKIGSEELYADLLAGFFISETRVPELIDVIATRYRTRKSFLDHFTALHIFVISLRCEHTCHYCQVSRVSADKKTFDMSTRHLDKGIELMLRSPNPHVTMEFQGGEALLAFDNIIYAVEKVKQLAPLNNKTVTFVICTNLAVITNDMLIFCKKHNILISTSLDGPDFIHNANRHRKGGDSYQLAIKGIQMARAILGNDSVSALLTTSPLSLKYPTEIVEEYYRLGFRSIFLRPISPYGFATKNTERNHYEIKAFLDFYKVALQKIIDYNLKGEFFREEYAAIILSKILTPFPTGYVDLQSPAGIINNVIVFNYDGKIYASDEARMLAEHKDYTFQLGHLDDSSYEDVFYGSKAKSFWEVITNESLTGCSECAFQPYCGADPVFHYATQGDMYGYRPDSWFCQKNMEIIRYLFELMDTNPDTLRIFYSWIK
jgi:His-Xaa-Ser system radical SAM maturase HxsB